MSSDAPLERIRRWEHAGGFWRVLDRRPGTLVVALLTCDAGEEMDRLVTGDPETLEYVGDREASDE